MLKILTEPKSTKLLNNFFFRKNKELIIIELLKLFFLIMISINNRLTEVNQPIVELYKFCLKNINI